MIFPQYHQPHSSTQPKSTSTATVILLLASRLSSLIAVCPKPQHPRHVQLPLTTKITVNISNIRRLARRSGSPAHPEKSLHIGHYESKAAGMQVNKILQVRKAQCAAKKSSIKSKGKMQQTTQS